MTGYAIHGDIILLILTLLPMLAAIVSFMIGRKNKDARNYFADAVTVFEFAVLVFLFAGALMGGRELACGWEGFCGLGLHLQLDGFRALYGTIAGLMWMMTTVFSREYFTHYRNRNRYYMFMLMTLGATLGVFLSADLYTTFIFFEIMSFTSFVWVAHEEKQAAMRAALTYLGVAVIGGLVMLMGIFLLYDMIHTLNLNELLPAVKAAKEGLAGDELAAMQTRFYIAGGLMVFGFGAKAGMFPLHIWLPKAHPVAPAPSSALLSGILTKSGIFGILAVTSNIFLHDPDWGMVILVLGTITMFGGALLAMFSVDFKRTLACSSMSQIGFILIGVGMQCLLGEENALAVRGTLLHMVNHSLIKLDLFMVAGVIYMNIHKLNLNEIRGFGRKKPLLMFSYLMGALGIGGIPLWNGYISKTLLHESIVEYTELLHAEEAMVGTPAFMTAIEWIFLISGGMTVAYMLKLFVCVFLEENSDTELQKQYDSKTVYWNTQSIFAVVGSAVILPILGFFPGLTMEKLADLGQAFMHGAEMEHAVHYFAFGNLKGAAISILIGVVLYFGLIRTFLMATVDHERVYVDRWPVWLDLENLIYRPILLGALPAVCTLVTRAGDSLLDALILLGRKTIFRQHSTVLKFPQKDAAAIKLGKLADKLTRTIDDENSHVHTFVRLQEETTRTSRIVAGSLSFGLMMVSTGLVVVLIYLLFM